MPVEQDLRARLIERDNGLRRLKTVTGATVVTVTALAGVFVGLAEQSSAARKLVRILPRAPATRQESTHGRAANIPAPPPLPALGGSEASPVQSAPPASPVQPPSVSSSPPVAVSGGS